MNALLDQFRDYAKQHPQLPAADVRRYEKMLAGTNSGLDMVSAMAVLTVLELEPEQSEPILHDDGSEPPAGRQKTFNMNNFDRRTGGALGWMRRQGYKEGWIVDQGILRVLVVVEKPEAS